MESHLKVYSSMLRNVLIRHKFYARNYVAFIILINNQLFSSTLLLIRNVEIKQKRMSLDEKKLTSTSPKMWTENLC